MMGDFRIGSYILPRKRVMVFAAAFVLWILGLILSRFGSLPDSGNPGGHLPLRFLPLIPFLVSWFFAGLPVLKSAVKNLLQGHALDENFLMSAATVGAFAVGEWEEAAGVMIFYMIGELVQEAAVGRSRSSIDALLALKPDKARMWDGETWIDTAAREVNPGSLVLVRPGERIPLDGIVAEGESSVDVSMLTGESRPLTRVTGDEVRSGTVSLNGVLQIRTTRSAENSSAAKIIQLVESAREAKATPERFITAFAKWYTPLVVGGANLLAVLPPFFVPGARFADWVYRALILLVISCPCALVVSVPLGYFAGIGGMSRRGIMVKGAVHLDSLNRTKNVVFDKTGTLTKGKFSIAALEPEAGISETTLLETAALAERESNHPIARAILEYTEENGGTGFSECGRAENEKAETSVQGRERSDSGDKEALPSRFEIAGQGLEIFFEETNILAGNRRLLESRGIHTSFPVSVGAGGEAAATDRRNRAEPESSPEEEKYTPVYIARNNCFLGRILIGDTLREGAVEAVGRLKEMDIQTSMFTGDTRSSALAVASRLEINSVEAELLPEDKLGKLEKLTGRGTTVFVGDGINDAPVLARSHVGIAMGSGADAAVEAADVIVMTDDPRRIPEAIERARKTHRIVMGNVTFALAAKGVFIVLAGLGMANMWIALIADVGVALAAILNSARALR